MKCETHGKSSNDFVAKLRVLFLPDKTSKKGLQIQIRDSIDHPHFLSLSLPLKRHKHEIIAGTVTSIDSFFLVPVTSVEKLFGVSLPSNSLKKSTIRARIVGPLPVGPTFKLILYTYESYKPEIQEILRDGSFAPHPSVFDYILRSHPSYLQVGCHFNDLTKD